MSNNKRRVYRVRFRETGCGRDGGLGEVKSFRCTAKSPKDAQQKLRRRATIISIREVK